MIKRRTALACPLLLGACAHTAPLALSEGQHPLQLGVPGLDAPVRLWLALPRGYHASPARWPLLVFLHGSGERGTDLARVKAHGPPKLADRGVEYPCILVSPQLEDGRRWEAAPLHALLQALQSPPLQLRIDPARVTATGLSLGGHGVWDWATAYPRDLAAIAPVCGFGEPEDVCRMRQVPVRAYHGDADTVVPLASQQACIDALRACGGTAEFIVFHGVGHDAWNPAYEDPALVPWLLARARA
jgi:predicted peptidase